VLLFRRKEKKKVLAYAALPLLAAEGGSTVNRIVNEHYADASPAMLLRCFPTLQSSLT
jgi:hypothetical protein